MECRAGRRTKRKASHQFPKQARVCVCCYDIAALFALRRRLVEVPAARAHEQPRSEKTRSGPAMPTPSSVSLLLPMDQPSIQSITLIQTTEIRAGTSLSSTTPLQHHSSQTLSSTLLCSAQLCPPMPKSTPKSSLEAPAQTTSSTGTSTSFKSTEARAQPRPGTEYELRVPISHQRPTTSTFALQTPTPTLLAASRSRCTRSHPACSEPTESQRHTSFQP